MSRRRRRNGFTLIEICVAALLIAIGATALFAVALSTRRTVAVSPLREQMNQYARLLSESLKGYVTACLPGAVSTACPASITDAARNAGAPHGTWALSKPDGTDCGTDGYNWALDAADADNPHDASCFLPAELTSAPPDGANATLKYTVAVADGARKFEIIMAWEEPD
ncbi:MAG: type II secretion system protein [Elusimicrobia bacterium]|nr:type II secretion system protein [Elusimicrobiota bacterium]